MSCGLLMRFQHISTLHVKRIYNPCLGGSSSRVHDSCILPKAARLPATKNGPCRHVQTLSTPVIAYIVHISFHGVSHGSIPGPSSRGALSRPVVWGSGSSSQDTPNTMVLAVICTLSCLSRVSFHQPMSSFSGLQAQLLQGCQGPLLIQLLLGGTPSCY